MLAAGLPEFELLMADCGKRPGFLEFLQKSRARAMSNKSDARVTEGVQAPDETCRSPASESILSSDGAIFVP